MYPFLFYPRVLSVPPLGAARLTLVLLVAAALPAHEEWNHLHIVYSARSSFVAPFDGRNPKVAVALLNHHEVPGPAVNFTFTVDGRRPVGTGFATFPDGGSVITDPDDYGLASAFTGGVYEGLNGPPPAVGETREVTFQFVFSLAPGAVVPPGATTPTNPDPANNGDVPGTTTARVRFTNLGDRPVLAGPLPVSGTVRAANARPGVPVNLRVEVGTPYSPWFPLPLADASPAAAATAFAQALPERDDWLLRFSADNCETRVVPVGFSNDPRPPFAVTLEAVPPPAVEYRRLAAITTPTGFWRGALAEGEGTFVAFPGQGRWDPAATPAEDQARRSASRIFKYRLDGTRLWEHAPGGETWAGDMSPDGRYVAYAPHPGGLPLSPPAEPSLVLLDGATGAVLWRKSAPADDPAAGRRLESLELAFSPDARWIAVGSIRGAVTLVDRASGAFIWTTPAGAAATFGQVRALRFSADAQFLYCGSGDSSLRKLRVADGAVLWRTFVGGWPDHNGVDLTPDGSWLAVGTQSLDTTLIRTSDAGRRWQREAQFPDATFAPDGRHVVNRGGQIYLTLDGTIAGLTGAGGPARFTPDSRSVVQAGRDLRLYDLGGKLLQTFESSGLPAGSGETLGWTRLTRDGRYAVLLGRDLPDPPQIGIVIYERRATAAAVAPAITGQPLPQRVPPGAPVTLAVAATGSAPLSYQWRRNGTPLEGGSAAAGPLLEIPGATPADAGSYTCTVSNAAGAATSGAADLTIVAANPADPGRLVNLAVRATVGVTPLIVGFSVGGSGTGGTKPLLIRGAGPALAALGVGNALADPRLELYSGATRVLANDNWDGAETVSTLATRLGAFPFGAAASRDAALVAAAVGGSFTVQLISADGAPGTALAEIYDGSPAFDRATPRLVNVSARTDVGGAAGGLIAGFVVAGSSARTILIRGIGPALAAFGVTNALADPQLSLYRDGVILYRNDHWHEAANALAVVAAAGRVGAFALAPGSRDAALLLSLPAGSYTAELTGSATAPTGSALVEVYEVP